MLFCPSATCTPAQEKEAVMAKGDKPTHDVLISNDGHYTKIGAGWEVAKEGISVQLSALPVDGKLVIFPVRKQDDG